MELLHQILEWAEWNPTNDPQSPNHLVDEQDVAKAIRKFFALPPPQQLVEYQKAIMVLMGHSSYPSIRKKKRKPLPLLTEKESIQNEVL